MMYRSFQSIDQYVRTEYEVYRGHLDSTPYQTKYLWIELATMTPSKVLRIQSQLSATLQWRHVRRIRNDIHHLIRINALAQYPSAFASACKYNGLGAYVDPFPCSKRPITITITNTIDSRCDCPISSDRGRSILRLIPGHTRSQSKVRCILYVGAPSVPFRLLSHRTFFRKGKLWPWGSHYQPLPKAPASSRPRLKIV